MNCANGSTCVLFSNEYALTFLLHGKRIDSHSILLLELTTLAAKAAKPPAARSAFLDDEDDDADPATVIAVRRPRAKAREWPRLAVVVVVLLLRAKRIMVVLHMIQ